MNKAFQSIFTRLAIALVIVAALGLTVVQPVQAAEIDDDGVVGADEVINDDLFLGGNETVVIDGTVNGMLFTAAQTVEINGTINGDVMAVGSVVTVSETGKVMGNIFLGAQTINLGGEIEGSAFGGSAAMNVTETASISNNLYYGGYSLTTEEGSRVGKDLLVGMYQAILNGEVARDARVAGGAVELHGSIGRNAFFQVDAPGGQQPQFFMPSNAGPALPPAIESGLRIDPNAEIGGKLTYTSPAAQSNTIKSEPSGGVVYLTPVPQEKTEKAQSPAASTAAAWGKGLFDLLRNMVTLMILGALALWLAPNFSQNSVVQARTRALPSALAGFLSILAGYTGAFVAFLVLIAIALFFTVVTLGGLSGTVFGVGFFGLGILVTIFTLAVSYGSKLVIALLVGQWIMGKLAPAAPGQRWWGLFIGVALFALLRAIPFLGWVIGLVVTLIGLGAIYFAIRHGRMTPAAPAVVETPAI